MVSNSHKPGPSKQLIPGTSKMAYTTQSKIITIISNCETNILLLIVEQLGHPEVTECHFVAVAALYYPITWDLYGMSPQVPGILSGVPWYVILCTWNLIKYMYDMTGKIVCVHTHPVVTYVTDGD
jgi:hypothetical protein